MSVLQSSIAAAGANGPAAYQIERSLRFNSADSAYLSWTPGSAGNRTTWTWSGWIKRSTLGTDQFIFDSSLASNETSVAFNTADQLVIYASLAGVVSMNLITSQVFRDVGAPFNLQISVDTTQATAANRVKIYVNGTQITAFGTSTYPAQNANLIINSVNPHSIGRNTFGANRYVNLYMTEINFVDGQALTPADFGETATATGVWTPKAYTGTYGNNGFYLPFNDNSSVVNLGRNHQTLTADPYFPVTTLLLNGNGTNGAQNNTFLDSSTNNFTITRNGNATQGTFSPFSTTGWSAYFTGAQTSPSLSFPTNAAYSLGSTTDFTIEMSVYFTGGIGSEVSLMERFDGMSGPGWIFGKSSTDKFWIGFGGSTYPCNTSLVANRWYHLCWVRTGGNSYLFVDGVLDRTAVTTANFTDGSAPLSLGERDSAGQTFPFTGYMSNVRIVKGTAVYSTSGFTPPTAALTAVTNTTLLTCQSNRFVDNSVTAATATVGTASSIQAFSPFAPTAAYSAATNGGSGYFDGSGDYLTLSNNTAFTFGTGDFTIEGWIYPTSIGSYNNLFHTGDNGTGQANVRLNAGKVEFFANDSAAFLLTGSTTLKVNTWTHIAVSRIGSTNRIFVNGVQDATATNAYGYAGSGSIQIGYWSANAGVNYFAGYMSQLRVLKGTGLYSTTFTPPTVPLTAITNTSFLLNFTNGGIIDATGKNVFETVGNAQISTTQSKWGGSSISVPSGTGHYLTTYDPVYKDSVGSGDWTFECWLYVTALPTSGSIPTALYHLKNDAALATTVFILELSNTGAISLSTGTAIIVTGTAGKVTAGSWIHFACVRSNGTFKTYFNGVLDVSVANTTTYNGAYVQLGAWRYSGVDNSLNGYIDDPRISKYARYTGNFSVPTAQFAYNQADINVKQWQPNNFSVTAGVGNDSLVDSPTNYGTNTGAGGEVRGNYCTLNPLDRGSDWAAPVNGNLDATVSGPNGHSIRSTMAVSSGKWYWEFTNVNNLSAGIIESSKKIVPATTSYWPGGGGFGAGGSYGYFATTGNKYTNETGTAYGATYTTTDVIGVALDMDAGTLTYYKNGVSQGTAFTGISGTFSPAWGYVGAGAGTLTANFGQRPFAYTAPSGFKALCSTNLPTPAIGASSTTLASKNMGIVTYTGTGASRSITGVGFQPDFVWAKSRSQASDHVWNDVVRGAGLTLQSDLTAAEVNEGTAGLTAFNTDGFTIGGASGGWNTNAQTYVAWNWKAGGTAVSNTAGSITSQVSANPTAGISVVTYTGTGAAGTIGHGLGVAPKMIIAKSRNGGYNWGVYHASLGNAGGVYLNTTDAYGASSTLWNSTTPTSTVFSVGNNGNTGLSANNYVAYCFAEVPGFSKFGSYTGNGSTDGPFVYCGFRPRFIMVKNTDAGTEQWGLIDSSRDPYNVSFHRLYPNGSNAENTGDTIVVDLLSNGFKLRSTDAMTNASRAYIFAAFAETPFQYARAR